MQTLYCTLSLYCIDTKFSHYQVKTVIGLVGGTKGIAECSRGVNIAGDISLAEALSSGPFDAVVLPGGMGGAKTLAEVWPYCYINISFIKILIDKFFCCNICPR